MPALETAIRDWKALLGAEHVSVDLPQLEQASTATFSTRARVLAILRPDSREAIQELLRIATTHKVPVYPVSSGKNWGYGSRVPPRDGVLVDLRRMNRILDYSEELGYVTVEPGVTQRQLHNFLAAKGSRLWMDATGASPDCSLVGNTMERGFGHTPMGDHCSHVCGLEVVLGSGDVIETGFARFDNSRTGALGRWGVGPSLDGLFSQSRLGIVTRMTIWLMPAPERFEAFFFSCRKEGSLAAVMDALRPLRMNGTLRSVSHIANDYKVLAGTSQYPWDETAGRTPLEGDAMSRIRRRLGLGYWNGSGGLYGTPAQVKDARRQLRRALAGTVDRLVFVNDRKLRLMRRLAGPFRLMTGWDIGETLKVLGPVYGLLKGVPTEVPMTSAYWRKKTPPPSAMDPDRDGCGLLWSSPVLPNIGAHAETVAGEVTRLLLSHQFEPQMSISMATERTLICVVTISYDRDVAGEDERAKRCYRALNERMLALGYPPYRWSVLSGEMSAEPTGFDRAVEAIASSFDPLGILAPGRYQAVRPGGERAPGEVPASADR
jgi:4-cresol dehydrogenase (hydroxylating)